MINFRQTEQIFQGMKDFKTSFGDRFRVQTDDAPIYKVLQLIDETWVMQGTVNARSADSALNKFLNGEDE